MWPLSFQEFGQEGCAAANGSRCWGQWPVAAWPSMEVAASTPGQPSSWGLCHHPAINPLPTSVLEHSLNLRRFFFPRVALVFNSKYNFQWFLWGEIRHEELEQSLCWRIFSCSFDVLSCCCSQIHLTVPLGEYQFANCERHYPNIL